MKRQRRAALNKHGSIAAAAIALLLVGAVGATYLMMRGGTASKGATANPRPEALPAVENPRGIVGGPLDETAFDFEPEVETESDRAPVLDGIPTIPDRIVDALEPYLSARQTRIAAVDANNSSLIVLTRLLEVSQAYRVLQPLAALHQLTTGPDPVAQAALIPGDAKHMLFRRDHGGDEQFQIYRLNVESGGEKRLTDGESRHGSFALTRNGQLAFTSNERSRGDMDVYVAPGGESLQPNRLIERGGQWMVGAWSRNGDRLLVRHYRSADSSSMFVADTATGELLPISLGKGELVMRDARFASDANRVLVVSDAGEDVAGLYEVDLTTGDTRALSSGIDWDVELVAVAQDRLAFVANEDGYSSLYFVDLESGERSLASGLPRGVISTLRFVGSSNLVSLTIATAQEPADAFTYDPQNGALVRWTDSTTEGLEARSFVAPELVRIASFDGLEIPAYVYRPAGDGPFPVLLWIHGGPEAQHRPAFDPLLQYFVAEQGITVIAPNIRGSTGYGRRYLGLDDGMRREDAIRDIGALLDWIEARPELDGSRVGIYGVSYGGFIVLAALIEYGQRFAAGCDVVGISHLVRFLENTSDYRRDLRRPEYGDEREPEMREFLERISPLTNADRIRSPLFVGHGANDPRVPVAEAEQIVDLARKNGSEVWYFLARDEGHGFRKRRSRDLFYPAMAAFFETYLKRGGPGSDAQPSANDDLSEGDTPPNSPQPVD